VYGAIKTTIPATNRMIAKTLGWDINRVTGRVTELVSMGMVTSDGTYKDKQTNRTVTLWKTL
jgi:DNA-binding MarR family transcriptional regulator